MEPGSSSSKTRLGELKEGVLEAERAERRCHGDLQGQQMYFKHLQKTLCDLQREEQRLHLGVSAKTSKVRRLEVELEELKEDLEEARKCC